jgi:predicted RNA-binding protein YlxR (DUF448 family)
VACRQPGDKRELVRFVRGTTGVVSLDATGRAPGRGAYICPEPECFARAQKTKALDRALKVRLSDSDYRNLADDLRAVIHGNC